MPNLDNRRCKLTASVFESSVVTRRKPTRPFLPRAIREQFVRGDGAEHCAAAPVHIRAIELVRRANCPNFSSTQDWQTKNVHEMLLIHHQTFLFYQKSQCCG